jgi:hypothetical protein
MIVASGLDVESAGGGDSAREPGATRLGDRHLGQRFRGAGPSAVRGP